jgi:hypothetical protein
MSLCPAEVVLTSFLPSALYKVHAETIINIFVYENWSKVGSADLYVLIVTES